MPGKHSFFLQEGFVQGRIPNNKDQEITEKLFSMMEKFAERLALMENQIRIAA